jgi:flagellar biosynthesis/type III secretory pathway protein FliH
MVPGNRPEDIAEEEFWETLATKMLEAGFKQEQIDSLGEMGDSNLDFATKAIEIARDLGYTRGFNEGRDEERMSQLYEQEKEEDERLEGGSS